MASAPPLPLPLRLPPPIIEPPECGLAVVQDPVTLDRKIVATKNFSAGELVFEEQAMGYQAYVAERMIPDRSVWPAWARRQWQRDPVPEPLRRPDVVHAWLLVYNLARNYIFDDIANYSFATLPLSEEERRDPFTAVIVEAIEKSAKGWDKESILLVRAAVDANSFSLEEHLSPSFRYGSALFPISSFFNHSCRSNLERTFEHGYEKPGSPPSLRFFARRNISKGEELTHVYTCYYDLLPRSVRKTVALPFACACSVCTANESLLPGEFPALGSSADACLEAWIKVRHKRPDNVILVGRFEEDLLEQWRNPEARKALLAEETYAGKQLCWDFLQFCLFAWKRYGKEGVTDSELVEMCTYIETRFFKIPGPARACLPLWRSKNLKAKYKQPDWDLLVAHVNKTEHGMRLMLDDYLVAMAVQEFVRDAKEIAQTKEVLAQRGRFVLFSRILHDEKLMPKWKFDSYVLFFRLNHVFEMIGTLHNALVGEEEPKK